MRKERETTVPAQRVPARAGAVAGGTGRRPGRAAGVRTGRAGPPGLRERARYWVDRTVVKGMTATVAWLALACLAVVAPASALLVWTDHRAPATFGGKLEQVWRTVGQTLRLGGEVGPPLRVALSVLLALVALIYVSTLVGLVTTGITDRLTELQRGQSTVVERGHTLVLGWSAQTPTVVAELVAAHAQRRGGVVVVLADRDKADMERELRGAVPDPGRVRLLCRRGRPADPAALARVCPGEARAVLVPPPDGQDGRVVRTLLALRAVVGEDGPVRIVAAVRDGASRAPAALAAGPGAVVLDVDGIAARLLVQCVREPGLAPVLEDLLDFSGAELHTVPLPLPGPGPSGRRFAALRAALSAGCVVGVVRADGEVLLAPPGDARPADGDGLLVLAEDGGSAGLARPVPDPDPSVMAVPPVPVPRPSRILVLGWNRRAPAVLDLLVRQAAPGSVVDVVAEEAPAVVTPAGGRPVAVRPHRGDPSDEAAVRRASAGHDRVLVLAADGDPDRALVTLLRLRDRERATGRRGAPVVELADDRDRALVPVGPGADVVGTGRLTGLLMSQVSQNGHLAAVFGELFGPDGAAVGLRPATWFVRAGAEASFATVVESAGRWGACAIGYRHGPGADRRVRLNPPKDEVRRWDAEDEVIVVARGTGPG
ncbi:NAD-binding lipoprotein [Streptomyces sp. NPDC004787]|uniref:CASTOR/POLLUX-related putative ion channel n=1 Tax=Streptomyces sp. NPDC004787 TaxID=3154291 RepID=UPI0033B284EF